MIKIAITGGIACGKTLLGTIWEGMGVAVCDADGVAHALMSKEGAACGPVAACFGPQVLGPDGGIDRLKLGVLVFADAAMRGQLNQIVHPLVMAEVSRWLAGQAGPVAAVLAPLLYEAGLDQGWDAVVCVAASRETQIRRLQARGMTAADAELRLAAQWPVAQKMERADYVVVNNGSLEVLREQAERVLNNIRER
jgi:dephospho-CoA kinase